MTIQEIVDLFEQLELHLINSLKRNLMRHRRQEQDEGGKDGVPENWEAWQSAKMRDVRRFRRENEKILGEYMPTIEEATEKVLQEQYAEGGADSFFGSSDPKLKSLIHEMQNNEVRVKQGCLRYMNDVYRKTILRTATAMNAGGMSLHKAVDEATEDFLAQGIRCIRYSNGRLVNIATYAEMALRTCNTRAMLMSSAAKKIQGTAGAAKKAMASLAGFDEIQKLDSNDSSGGGGGAAEVQPNFDFQGQSSFLDSVMESVKAGNWGDVGAILSKKLNSCLNSINWPNIQKKASSWISGLVEGINGFVQNLDWGAVGSTIGESLNTLITSVGTFFANMDWTSLGSGIGEGITSIFTSINWEQYKQSLTEGFNGILELVSGFASGFAPLQGIDFSAATESLQGLWQSVWDFAELVGGALAEVYNTVLKPILKWAIEDAVPASVDVFTAAFDALSAILKPVMEGLDGLMAGLEPVIAFIEDVAMIALEGLKEIFEKVGQVFTEKGGKVQEIVSGIGDIITPRS